MKNEDELPPLRDLPTDHLARSGHHRLAGIGHEPGFSRSRWRRLAFSAVVAAAALSAVIASAVPGSRASATHPKYTAARAASVADVISQVQDAFSDGLIRSASIQGSTLDVAIATPQEDSETVSRFEAAVLGHAVADWQGANGQSQVAKVQTVVPSGTPFAGLASGEPIGLDSSATPLASDSCERVASQAPASAAVLARTLPFAGGTCIIKVETSADPIVAAPAMADALSEAIADPSSYPYLIEVDDPSGTPQIVETWVPGTGAGGNGGQGGLYVRPGLPGGSSLHY